MTPAIKPGQPRQRPERACTCCRKAKTKCVADPTGQNDQCARCFKMNLECEYVALRKIGRPRRLLAGPPVVVVKEEEMEIEYQVPDDFLNSLRLESPVNSFSPPKLEVPRSPPELPSEITYHCMPDDLDSISTFYIESIHTFLPILPSEKSLLVAYLQTCPLYLIVSLSALQFPEIATSFPLETLEPNLAAVQAALFFTHASYGRGKHYLVRDCLKWASSAIVGLIEAMESKECGFVFETMDLIRSAYWECWSLEIMTSVVLGLRRTFLQDLQLSVHLPTSEAANVELSGLGIKIRALALLSTCTLPPTGNAVDVGRVRALTDLGANLTLLARESFRSNLNVEGCAGRAAREASFMAGLIGSAAVIYLNRASFAASAFMCGLDSTTEITPATLYPIRRASRFIFDLLRETYQPNATTHSPFFGCSLMIASTGTMSTLTDGAASDWDAVSVSSDLELAEFLLNIQTNRWSGTQPILNEVRRMRLGLEIVS